MLKTPSYFPLALSPSTLKNQKKTLKLKKNRPLSRAAARWPCCLRTPSRGAGGAPHPFVRAAGVEQGGAKEEQDEETLQLLPLLPPRLRPAPPPPSSTSSARWPCATPRAPPRLSWPRAGTTGCWQLGSSARPRSAARPRRARARRGSEGRCCGWRTTRRWRRSRWLWSWGWWLSSSCGWCGAERRAPLVLLALPPLLPLLLQTRPPLLLSLSLRRHRTRLASRPI